MHYFTGIPCPRGHIAPRYTSVGTCVECNRERNNSQRLVAFRKAYYAAQYRKNREAILARGKKYNATEDGHASALIRAARRRARKRDAIGEFTVADLKKLHVLQRDRCANCGKSLKSRASVDHIVPLVRGGTNDPSNLQLLCRSCNSRKHTKDVLDFAHEQGRLL